MLVLNTVRVVDNAYLARMLRRRRAHSQLVSVSCGTGNANGATLARSARGPFALQTTLT